MLTIDTGVDIDRPIADVWAALTDFASYGRWNPYLVHVEGLPVAGTKLMVHSRSGPGASPLVQSVELEAIAPFAMLWRGGLADATEFAGEHRFELMPIGLMRTRFHHYEHFTGSRAIPILERYRVAITDNFIRFNQALKQRVENR